MAQSQSRTTQHCALVLYVYNSLALTTIDPVCTLKMLMIITYVLLIQEHCPNNQNYDFHKYMLRTLEKDFKKIIGISWYLWLFVVIFLLLNIAGKTTNLYFQHSSNSLLLLLCLFNFQFFCKHCRLACIFLDVIFASCSKLKSTIFSQ